MLYIFLFLHQTTTSFCFRWALPVLYIFLFLHQTTTIHHRNLLGIGCISFFSYIKPQLVGDDSQFLVVVYLSFPTSNHNSPRLFSVIATVVYLSFPTSNHNCRRHQDVLHTVVYLSFPTSNHNWVGNTPMKYQLYIFLFLHQTTTAKPSQRSHTCCISFFSYIKPQLNPTNPFHPLVVYLSFPTSNHNSLSSL